MTTERKISMLQSMLGPEDEEDSGVLEVYLEIARQKILNRMYQFGTDEEYDGLEVPDRYISVQLNISLYLLNKRGAEGEIQHIENGIHRNYGSSDIPDALLKDVTPFCKAIR